MGNQDSDQGSLVATFITPDVGPQVIQFVKKFKVKGNNLSYEVVYEKIVPSHWDEITDEDFRVGYPMMQLVVEDFLKLASSVGGR